MTFCRENIGDTKYDKEEEGKGGEEESAHAMDGAGVARTIRKQHTVNTPTGT